MELGRSKIDPTLVREGIWTEFLIVGPDREPVTIKLKMAMADAQMNPRYKEALRKGLEPYERMLSLYKKATEIPTSLAQKINDIGRRVFVEQIVLDWEGPTKSGQPLTYTPDACIALFEEYPELMSQAEAEASKFERYRVAVLEEASGN